MSTPNLKIISASRRTDLVAFYPDFLAEKIGAIGPERIHTLVIWTKNPENLLVHRALKSVTSKLDQLYILLTVTGLGGTSMEPAVPKPPEVISLLPELADFTKDPERIAWRFDPILNWTDGMENFTNIKSFNDLASSFSTLGVKRLISSFCTIYPKVIQRFREHSRFEPVTPSRNERIELKKYLSMQAERHGFDLEWCCEPGEPPAACIDGRLLTELHPDRLPAPVEASSGQRELCGCTKSWDIGWYNQPCGGRCLYCYANPEKW